MLKPEKKVEERRRLGRYGMGERDIIALVRKGLENEDVTLKSAFYDQASQSLQFVIEGDEFEPVNPGEIIPFMGRLTLTRTVKKRDNGELEEEFKTGLETYD